VVAVNASGDTPTCPHGADGLAAELRAVAVLALDRVEPLLARLRHLAADDTTACPVCAALDVVREHRPELGRVAEHGAGLLAALRAALDGPAAPTEPTGSRPAGRRVQHIPVERVPADRRHTPDGAAC
jgi:hypothetical protein